MNTTMNMIFMRNKTIYFQPVEKISNNTWRICWNYKEEYEDEYIIKNGRKVKSSNKKYTGFGSWLYFIVNSNIKPTVNDIKTYITDYINDYVSKKITTGYKWNGFTVDLSKTNQLNYKASYDLAVQTNGQNLPVKIKMLNGNDNVYYTFENLDEFTQFYTNSVKHVQDCLEAGWDWKDSIIWDIYK